MRRGLIRRDENWARDWRSISRRQTGYSQPIPRAGIGGSPRFAAHARIWHFRESIWNGANRPTRGPPPSPFAEYQFHAADDGAAGHRYSGDRLVRGVGHVAHLEERMQLLARQRGIHIPERVH